MLQNSYFCVHSAISTQFCFCQPQVTYLCNACISKHEGHEKYPIERIGLLQTLNMDQAAFKSRLETYERCLDFLNSLTASEIDAQSNAEVMLRRVTEVFEELMERRHRIFESIVGALKEETEMLLTKFKPKVSPLAQALQAKSGESGRNEACRAILRCAELSGLEEALSRAADACSGSEHVLHLEYEEQFLAAFATLPDPAVQSPTELPPSPLLPTPMAPSANSLTELAGPSPDYLTQAGKDTLDRLGPYPFQYDESPLVKRGPLSVDNGVYIGQWNSQMQRHGQGQQTWPDGRMYEGQWRNGQCSGKGRLIGPKGEAFVGDFEADRLSGFVEEYQPDGSQYSGTFRTGRRDGFGYFHAGTANKYPKSDYYGEWEKGVMRGKGVRFYENGSIYVGEWAGGREDGQGVLIWQTGHFYQGKWKVGKRSGMGCMLSPVGERWEGLWADDQLVRPTTLRPTSLQPS